MTQYRRLILLLLAGCFILAGCGRTSPPSSYYILTGPESATLANAPLSDVTVGVGPVTLPGHLDRSQIVTRTGQNSIKIHEYQRWGDTLQRQLEETLAKNLSLFLKTPRVTIYPWERALRPNYQVFVTVRKFEGTMGQSTTLDAIWQIVDVNTNTSLLTKNVIETVPIPNASMEAYVQAQSIALEALSQSIAQGIHSIATK